MDLAHVVLDLLVMAHRGSTVVLLTVLVLRVLDAQTGVRFFSISLLHVVVHIGLGVQTKFICVIGSRVTFAGLLLRFIALVVVSLTEMVSSGNICVTIALLMTINWESVGLPLLLLLLGS